MTSDEATPIELPGWKCSTANHVYYRQTPQHITEQLERGTGTHLLADQRTRVSNTMRLRSPSLEVLTLYRVHVPNVSDLAQHLSVLADQMSTNGCLYPPDEPLEQVLRQFSYDTHLSWAQREKDALETLQPILAAYVNPPQDHAKHQLVIDWWRYVIHDRDSQASHRAMGQYALVRGAMPDIRPINLEVVPESERTIIEPIAGDVANAVYSSLTRCPKRVQLIPNATEEYNSNLLRRALSTIAPYAKPGE